jgi:hypothetical protein
VEAPSDTSLDDETAQVRQRRGGEPAFDEQPELLDGRHREQPGLLEVREGSASRLVHDHVGRIRAVQPSQPGRTSPTSYAITTS